MTEPNANSHTIIGQVEADDEFTNECEEVTELLEDEKRHGRVTVLMVACTSILEHIKARRQLAREADGLRVQLAGAEERAKLVLAAKDGWVDRARAAEDEADDLLTKVLEVEDDTKRLDWLERVLDEYPLIRVYGGGSPGLQYFTRRDGGDPVLNAPSSPNATLRGAIDAAMAPNVSTPAAQRASE